MNNINQLLNHNQLEWEEESPQELRPLEQVEEDYRKGEARVVLDQGRHLLPELANSLEQGRYKIDPAYQRGEVWNSEKKSRLIESFIINIPIPPIFFYEYEYSKFEVMDGVQRLTAIRDFYANDLTLEGLDLWPELNGKTYNELPETIQQAVDRRFMSSVTILKENLPHEQASKLRREVFSRINTGGTSLNEQELRNAAVEHGPLAEACKFLSEHPAFQKMWGLSEEVITEFNGTRRSDLDVSRMEDIETVLRYFAVIYRLENNISTPLQQTLDEFWNLGNRYIDKELMEKLSDTFIKATNLLWDVLGDESLALYRKRNQKMTRLTPPSMMMYDCNMLAFTRFIPEAEKLKEKSNEIRTTYVEMFEEKYELFDGRKTDRNDLNRRIEALEEAIRKVI